MTVLEKMTLMLNTADSIVLVEVHVVAIHPLEHHIGLVYHQEPDEIYQPLLAHMSLSISLKLLYNFLLYTCVFDHVFSGVLTLLHLTRITLICYHFISLLYYHLYHHQAKYKIVPEDLFYSDQPGCQPQHEYM